MLAIKDEKKAEYIELIYDLIFVYIIGRNNSLLHHTVNGFVTSDAFVSYVLCTLAIIQIWSFGTFYLNRYGRFGARDCVFLFLALLGLYSKKRCAFHKKFIISLIAVVLSFIVLMLLFREQMYVNIAITVVYVFGIFIMLFFRDKKSLKK